MYLNQSVEHVKVNHWILLQMCHKYIEKHPLSKSSSDSILLYFDFYESMPEKQNKNTP